MILSEAWRVCMTYCSRNDDCRLLDGSVFLYSFFFLATSPSMADTEKLGPALWPQIPVSCPDQMAISM